MPKAVLSLARLERLSGLELPQERLEELLFPSKAEVKDVDGDALTIDASPDRLDLLCESGLAQYLDGVTGRRRGRTEMGRLPGPSELEIVVDSTVDPLRPFIAAAIVGPPKGGMLDADLIDEAIAFQEILHATLGLDRKRISLGLYPLDGLSPPMAYTSAPLEGITFTPLDGVQPVTAGQFFEVHPQAQRYGDLGRFGSNCLVLRDRVGKVLSLPPVLNSREAGEIRPGDTQILIESTGTVAARVREAVGLMLLPFAAREWTVAPVPVSYPAGRSDGAAILSPPEISFPSSLLASISGKSLSASEVEHAVATARLTARPAPHGWTVAVPPWRPDLFSAVDVAEDVVLTLGVKPEDGVLPAATTLGRLRDETRFRRRVSEVLLGAGFQPLVRPVLIPSQMSELLGRVRAIRISNPVSAEYAVIRDTLLPSLLRSLGNNLRAGYPQRLAEVGPVVVRDDTAESGGSTRYKAGLVLAMDRAGFADAAALTDAVLRCLGVLGVREPMEIPGTIPGRAARLRLAGEQVAEMGEVDPVVLASLSIPVPVAWAELDLSALWPLLRRPMAPA